MKIGVYSKVFIEYVNFGIAVIALVLSYVALKNSNKQFTLVNQSYLQAEATMDMIKLHTSTINAANNFDDSISIKSIIIKIKLENLGNIPLKFSINDFNIERYNRAISVPLINIDPREDIINGVLHPKENIEFEKTLQLTHDPSKGSTIGSLKSLKVNTYLNIEYNDINSDHIKHLDRSIRFDVTERGVKSKFTSINDKI